MASSRTLLMAGTLALVLLVGSSSGAPGSVRDEHMSLDERIRLEYPEYLARTMATAMTTTTTEPPVVIGYPRVTGPDRRERSNTVNVSAISLNIYNVQIL